MSKIPKQCPKCGAKSIAEILYGLPDFDEELNSDLKEGRLVLGGCIVSDDAPQWHCNECRHEFGEAEF